MFTPKGSGDDDDGEDDGEDDDDDIVCVNWSLVIRLYVFA